MKKSLAFALTAALLGSAATAHAQNEARPGYTPDLTPPQADGPATAEGFDDITLLPVLGWILDNQSNPLGTIDWFQGNPDVFAAHAGAPAAYIAANFNNTAGGTGQICNYLILPDVGQIDAVSFWTRTSPGSIWPDRLRVVYSPTGGTTTGDCVNNDGDFTTELLSINDGLAVGGYPEDWGQYVVNPGGTGRVALVYDVSDAGPSGTNSNFIGIDTLAINEVILLDPPARFQVVKQYDDGNTTEVEMTLSCNTGLPLEQTIGVAPGAPVNFVVNDFVPGELSCTVTEAVPAGYEVSYDDTAGTVSADSCAYDDIGGGQFGCVVTNSLLEVEVEVTKVWIDENPQFNGTNIAEAEWFCSNTAFCEIFTGDIGACSGNLNFFGSPGEDSFFVYPDWENGTVCDITEVMVADGGVEIDDSECQDLVVWPGQGTSCTIYNTRLYEGIPTLSQYGLGVLVLVMLGMGFVAVRRFV